MLPSRRDIREGDHIDSRELAAAAVTALKRGDPRAARDLFLKVIVEGSADAAVWFGLSAAHRDLHAVLDQGAALDQALRLDPNHLPALIAKGDLLAEVRDRRAASSYYNAALKLASAIPSTASEWRADLARIEVASQKIARDYETHLMTALSASGMGEPGSERFARAIDLLLGKKQIYLQQPKYFFFPELPQIQFFDRRTFPWTAALEAKTASIRAEIRAVLKAGKGIVPYIQREADRPARDILGLMDNYDWSVFFLFKDGKTVADNAALCPGTVAALDGVPLCRIDKRTPSVHFSILRAGARIPPHHGFMNARLICHLPLIVPPRCGLRVGSETRQWHEGQLLIFDDSIEHEAWNGSDQPRAVLIFDIWRPELSFQERNLIASMLSAIKDFDGREGKWVD